MAKFTLHEPFASFSGKICKHEDIIFAKKSKTGLLYTSKICRPRTSPLSADELAQRAKFKAASDYAKQLMQDPDQRIAAEQEMHAKNEAGANYTGLRPYLISKYFSTH